MIKVGLIGCGFMGGMHAACYAALADLGVKVTAIADDRPDFLEQMEKQTGAQAYESGMALIQNAYYTYNGETKVWMGAAGATAKWTDAAFVPI